MSEPERAQQVHVLVDLENNQPTLAEVRSLVPELTSAWLFHSPGVASHVDSYVLLGEKHTPVPLSRPGKNSLDFHLAFYVGYIAAKYPQARQVVVAIDRGYTPMVEHANTLGVDVRIVPFKSGAQATKVATTKGGAEKAVAKKTPAKAAKPKKSVAKKSPVQKTPTAKATPTKQATKKVSGATRARAKKIAPAKAPSKKPVAAKKKLSPAQNQIAEVMEREPVPSKVRAKAEPSAMQPLKLDLQTIIQRLHKMGAKRPPKHESLLRYLAAQMRCSPNDPLVNGMWGNLLAADAVRLDGAAVVYRPVITGAGV